MAPVAALSRNNIFFCGDCRHSLDLIYFSLQCKYCALYLGVSFENNLILNIVILYFLLINDILGLQFYCSIIIMIYIISM